MVEVERVLTLSGHKDAIYTLERGVTPFEFYSAGGDGYVVKWDARREKDGHLIARVSASVYALCLIAEEEILIVGENYEGIHCIDLKNNKIIGTLALPAHAIFDIQLYDGCLLIATGGGWLYVVSRSDLKVVHQTQLGEQSLRRLWLTQDDRAWVASSDGCLRKVDLHQWKVIEEIEAHRLSVFALASVDEKTLISGSRDAQLKFWNTDTPTTFDASVNAHLYAINDLALKPDTPYFASASMDKTIKIWDIRWRKLLKVIDKARHNGHLSSVNKLLWLDEPDYLVSCSDDRSIGVWRIAIKI